MVRKWNGVPSVKRGPVFVVSLMGRVNVLNGGGTPTSGRTILYVDQASGFLP